MSRWSQNTQRETGPQRADIPPPYRSLLLAVLRAAVQWLANRLLPKRKR